MNLIFVLGKYIIIKYIGYAIITENINFIKLARLDMSENIEDISNKILLYCLEYNIFKVRSELGIFYLIGLYDLASLLKNENYLDVKRLNILFNNPDMIKELYKNLIIML